MLILPNLNLEIYNQKELHSASTSRDDSTHSLDDLASSQACDLLDAARQLRNYYRQEEGDQEWAKGLINLIMDKHKAVENLVGRPLGSTKSISIEKAREKLDENQRIQLNENDAHELQQALTNWARQNECRSIKNDSMYGQLQRLLEALKKLYNYSRLEGDQEWVKKLINTIADKSIFILDNYLRGLAKNQRCTEELIKKINALRNKVEIALDDQDHVTLDHFKQQNGYKSVEEAALQLILRTLESTPPVKNKGPVAGTPLSKRCLHNSVFPQ